MNKKTPLLVVVLAMMLSACGGLSTITEDSKSSNQGSESTSINDSSSQGGESSTQSDESSSEEISSGNETSSDNSSAEDVSSESGQGEQSSEGGESSEIGETSESGESSSENSSSGEEDTKRFQIASEQWESMIYEGGLVSMTANFSVIKEVKDYQNQITTVRYEFDNAKVHYRYSDKYSENENYYEFTGETTNNYYYKDNYDAWVMGHGYTGISSYTKELGLLPLHFDDMMFISNGPYYYLEKYTDEFSNIYSKLRFFFSDGKLMKIYYESMGDKVTIGFMNYDTTTVTLPELGGGNHPTQDQLNDLVRNKEYLYSRASDYDSRYDTDKLNEFYTGNKFSFFSDDTFEVVYNRSINYQTGETSAQTIYLIGSFQVLEDANKTGKNYITCTINKIVYNGIAETTGLEGTSMRARITPADDTLTITEDDGDIYVYFAKTANTPTHVTYQDGPQYADWPSALVTRALTSKGFTDELPALTTPATRFDVELDGSDYDVRVAATVGARKTEEALASYETILERARFTFDDDNNIWKSPNKEYTVNFANSGDVFYIKVKAISQELPPEPVVWPGNTIKGYLGDYVIPDLSHPDATGYEVDKLEESVLVTYSFPVGTDLDVVLTYIKGLLTTAGYHTDMLPTIYTNGILQIFVSKNEGKVLVAFHIVEVEPAKWPTDQAEEYLGDNNLPDLTYEGVAEYQINGNKGYCCITYVFPDDSTVTPETVVAYLRGVLEGEGYIPKTTDDYNANVNDDWIIITSIEDGKATLEIMPRGNALWPEDEIVNIIGDSVYLPDLGVMGVTSYDVEKEGTDGVKITINTDAVTHGSDIIDSITELLLENGFKQDCVNEYDFRNLELYIYFMDCYADYTIMYIYTNDLPDEGYGLLFGDYTYAKATYFNEDNGFTQYKIDGYEFKKGQTFNCHDFGWGLDFETTLENASEYVEYDEENGCYVVKQDFKATVYIKLQQDNDHLYLDIWL